MTLLTVLIFGFAILGGFSAGFGVVSVFRKLFRPIKSRDDASHRWMSFCEDFNANGEWQDWLADDVGDKGFSLPLRTLENIPPDELEKMAWEHLRNTPREKWLRIIFSSGFEVKL